jgi:hypothetical protein
MFPGSKLIIGSEAALFFRPSAHLPDEVQKLSVPAVDFVSNPYQTAICMTAKQTENPTKYQTPFPTFFLTFAGLF